MAISRIKTDGIQDDAVTQPKIKENITLDGTEFVRLPAGTTAQRPSSAAGGQLRFNTDLGTLEQYNTNTSSWQAIDSPPIISSLAYAGSLTGANPAGGETITLTGTNFKTGFTISIGGTSAATTTFVNDTTVRFTTPVKTAGDYDITFVNSNGLQATLTNGISYNGVPAFSTAAGNLGSIKEDAAMSTITIVAAEPDGGTLAYSVTSGALPSGVSLGSANGQLTGTPNVNPTADTTFNFTVTATDDENQTNARAFNLIVLRLMQPYSLTNSMINEKVDNSFLHRTPSSASNRKKFTFSTWIKLSSPPTTGYYPRIFSAATANGSQSELVLTQTGQIRYEDRAGNSLKAIFDSNMTILDTTGWGHIMLVVDIANSTQSERTKIYWNGVQITSWAASTEHTDTSYDSYFNSNVLHRIGESATYTGNRLGGYLAETHFVDGQALAPTVFGEDYNDSWVPKQVTGVTYGTNGFYLNYQTANNLGDDVSGQTNDYAETGTQFQSVDTPTNNFPTMNMNFRQSSGVAVKEGGLYPYKASARYLIGSTAAASKSVGGKYYLEVQIISLSSVAGGLAVGFTPNGSISQPDSEGDMQSRGGWRVRLATGNNASSYAVDGGSSGTYATNVFSIGDWVGIGLDFDNDKFQIWSSNGTLRGDIDISSRVNKETSYVFAMGCESGGHSQYGRVNFGATAFQRTGGMPSGYQTFQNSQYAPLALDPTVNEGPQKNFRSLIWTGNNANSRAITGQGFSPDILWIKVRNANYQHMLFTSPIGPNKVGHTQANSIFDTNFQYGYLTSFDNDGYTLQAGSSGIENLNETNKTYVGWGWKCGGTPTATNSASIGAAPTSGSVMIDGVASTAAVAGTLLTKKLSASTKNGCSTSIYVGNGTSTGSFAHGLGKAPSFVLHKRIDAADSWIAHWQLGDVGPRSFSVETDNGAAISSDATYASAHTTSVVSMTGSSGARNTNNEDHIAICFADVPGYSSIGRYIGTGNLSDERGPFIECGFRPAWIFGKRAAAGEDPQILDSARDSGVNQINHRLFPSLSSAEDTNPKFEFHATGFRILTSGTMNTDGQYYYYIAFADQPDLFSNAGLLNVSAQPN